MVRSYFPSSATACVRTGPGSTRKPTLKLKHLAANLEGRRNSEKNEKLREHKFTCKGHCLATASRVHSAKHGVTILILPTVDKQLVRAFPAPGTTEV